MSTKARPRRPAWPTVGLVMVAVISAACSGSNSGSSSTSQSAKNAPPARFESGPCPKTSQPVPALATARCGFLVVPENRANPNGRTIRLAIATIPSVSKTPAPDPIVYMTGGPGVDAIGLGTNGLVKAGLNRDRDLIIVEQRGTKLSQPALLCPEIDKFNAVAVGLPYDAPATGKEHVDATRACHQRLAKTGIDLSAYNTTENAADFAGLRTALGVNQWNVYGSSYGTDLALTYMRQHPQGIRSVVIDSVFPPDIASLGTTWSSVREVADNIFAACAQQPACAQRYPDLAGTFTRLVQQLEAHPVTTVAPPAQGLPPIKVVIDGGALVQWFVGIGAQTADIPAGISALAHGDPGPVAESRASAADPSQAGIDGTGLFYGAFCSEWVPYQAQSEVLKAGKRAFPAFPDAVLSQAPQLAYLTEDCQVWNVPKAPAVQRADTTSTIPTLVVSGTFDARTSPALGEHAAQALPNSKVVNVPGIGHVVVTKSQCAQQVFQSFLASPTAPDTSCVATLQPPPFTAP